MGLSETKVFFTEDDVNDILTYNGIAELHGAFLSLRDALKITSLQLSEQELEEAWGQIDPLASAHTLFSGYIVRKDILRDNGPEGLRRKIESSRNTVESNLQIAREVSRVFADRSVKLFSVSGGNSYNFADKNDDIDFFCVTKKDGLWLFFLKTLLIVRFYRIFKRDLPRLCFSYVIDEEKASKEFRSPGDRLFARDALSLKVILGRSFYSHLLAQASWMEDFFPKLYANNLSEPEYHGGPEPGRIAQQVLNSFLCRVLGAYIRLKCRLDNARCRKRGEEFLVNEIELSKGHILYESKKYRSLRLGYIWKTFGKHGRTQDGHSDVER